MELKSQKKQGRGDVSIYGRSFEDDNMDNLSHDLYGVVMMANAGAHTNNFQFMINVDPDCTDWCMYLRHLFALPYVTK